MCIPWFVCVKLFIHTGISLSLSIYIYIYIHTYIYIYIYICNVQTAASAPAPVRAPIRLHASQPSDPCAALGNDRNLTRLPPSSQNKHAYDSDEEQVA